MDLFPTLLGRRRALSPFSTMEDLLNTWRQEFPTPFRASSALIPVDVTEEDKRYVIEADLPGIEKNQINVSLEGNLLTIQTQMKKTEEKEEGNYIMKERCETACSRSVTLPLVEDNAKVDATLRDGVLTVCVPKASAAQTRRIEIH
jgi:HSP20 family protein